MSFFHCRASADICTVAEKPSFALMIPMDRPRLPVEPTATLYPESSARMSSVAKAV